MSNNTSALSAIAISSLLLLVSPAAQACNIEPYIGSVCATAAPFYPKGYLPADGRHLSVAQNQALFALLSNTYGGNGQTDFALPDLRGRSAIGAGQPPGEPPVQLGQQRGQASVTLTEAQMPSHSHGANYSAGDLTGKIVATTAGANQTEPGPQRHLATSRAPIYSDSQGSQVEMG